MAYLNAITKTIKQIQDSDEKTRDRYNYHRGLSLHMIKKLMGADHSQWAYINNALKSGVNKGKLIKTGGKYRVAATKKKSRKLRKCKYGRDRTTGKCRKRRSVKRKTSRKRRSVKRKTSRKRRSVKRKTSRKRRSVKRKTSRKRRSVKRKTSRKRRSVKRKTSRKRRSTKRKGKKLKFRITSSERAEIEQIEDKKNARCSICLEPLLDGKKVSNEDIVGCVGASEIPGWTCCSKTKKTGCKNSYWHKKCIETWVKHQERQDIPPSCPICRAEKPKKKVCCTTDRKVRLQLAGAAGRRVRHAIPLVATAAALLVASDQITARRRYLSRGEDGSSVGRLGSQIRRCYDPSVDSLDSFNDVSLPECRDGCTYIKDSGNNIHTFELTSPPRECPLWMRDSWTNWHKNMTPEEWRKSQGIPPSAAKITEAKHDFGMSKKKSRKRRSVKRKVSRKRRSAKRKTSRKRRSVKRKTSRKRRSVKRKTSRKRRSTKRKGKKLKFRITSSERAEIEKIYKEDKKNKEARCSICLEPLIYLDDKIVKNKDIVGCAAAEKKGYLCCAKQTGCKNNYFHKVCLDTWFATGNETCPLCRKKRVKKKPPSTSYAAPRVLGSLAALLVASDQIANFAGNLYRGGQIRRCHDSSVKSLASFDGIPLPECRDGCTYITGSGNNIPHTFELTSPPRECPLWMPDSWTNWHANMEARREREGIPPSAAKITEAKHNFRMSKKKSRKRRSVKRKTSRKRRSVKRKSRKMKSTKRKSRKMKSMKSRQSPPSGVIKKENLKPGTIRVGADGKTKYEVCEYVSRGKKIKKWKKYVPLYLKFRMLTQWTPGGGHDDWDAMYSDDEGGEGGKTKSSQSGMVSSSSISPSMAGTSVVSSSSISPSMARLPPEIIKEILNYDDRKRGDLHPVGNLDGPNSLQMKNLRERMSRFKAFQRLVKSNQLVQVALPGKGVHYFTNQYGQPSRSNTSAYPPLGTESKAQERGGYELNSRISGDPADFALMMEYILDIVGSGRQIFNGVSSRSGEHLTPQQKQEVRRLLARAYTHKEQGFDDRHLFGEGDMAETSKIKNEEERKAYRRQILNHPVNGYARINGQLLPLPLKIFRRGRRYGVVPSDRYPTTDQRPVAPDGSNVDEAHDIFWPETRAEVRRFLNRKPSLRELFSRVNPALFH